MSAPNAAGFTLIELIVVAGVLSVLLGLGVGFLGRSSGEPEAISALSAQLRAASLQARSRGLPTETIVEPRPDGNAVVRTRGLEPLTVVSFEPEQRAADPALAPALGGADVPSGRFGHARTLGEAPTSPVLRLPLPPAAADFRDGFALRLDLRLDRRDAGTLLRLARAIEVVLDEDANVRVRIVPAGLDGAAGAAKNLHADRPLPVGRWCTLEIGADGSACWCAIDGRTVAREALDGHLMQTPEDVLDVLPQDQPLAAAVDELQLFAYAFLPPLELPQDVEPEAAVRVPFDARGEPMVERTIRLRLHREQRTIEFRVGPGGVLL